MGNIGRGPDPRNNTLRAILARSGNQCAFPGCVHPIVNEKHQFIAQVCHIEAAAPDGQRYNPAMTEEQRRAYDNLLLLCYRHHIETNDIREFTVEALKRMKAQHEAQFQERLFKPSEEVVEMVARVFKGVFRERLRGAILHFRSVGATSIDEQMSFYTTSLTSTALGHGDKTRNFFESKIKEEIKARLLQSVDAFFEIYGKK